MGFFGFSIKLSFFPQSSLPQNQRRLKEGKTPRFNFRQSESIELQICFLLPLVLDFCIYGSSSCLGCYKGPKFDPLMNDTSKGVEVPDQAVRKTSISEDFWTTSTCDMDNSAAQSQGSISSISMSNQSLDPQGNANSPSEFVNHGLLLWNQTRQQWIGNKKSEKQPQKVREPKLSTYGLSMVNPFWPCSWNVTYESLLGNNKPFPQPIPLPEMIDFLVDIWEQEGLYD